MSDNKSHQNGFKAELPTTKLHILMMDQEGNDTIIKTTVSTKFVFIKTMVAERMGKSKESLRFLWDGIRLGDQETPESIGMIKDTRVSVYLEQTGGGTTC